MAGSGMVKHHLTPRGAALAPQRRRSTASRPFLSVTVVLIFAVAKFKEGAWLIVVVGPLLYFGPDPPAPPVRRGGRAARDRARSRRPRRPILRRHVVVVLVDRLDMATARALQYARTLAPDDLRAVHFDIDTKAARELEEEWGRLGLARLPLDIIECPDRRLGRAAIELVADATLDGDTECTVLLPRRSYAAGLAALPARPHGRQDRRRAGPGAPRERHHRPLQPGRPLRRAGALLRPLGPAGPPGRHADGEGDGPDRRRGPQPASTAGPPGRAAARPARGAGGRPRRWPSGPGRPRRSPRSCRASGSGWPGRVKSVRVQPRAGTSNLECVLSDGTGGLLLVFQGRPKIAGIEPGARLVAEGMVGTWGRRPAMLNPSFELVAGADRATPAEA